MSSRTPLIAGNWKMHKTGFQAVEAASQLKRLVNRATDVEVMIAPTFTALYQVAQALKGSTIALGAQNLYWEKQGAFTGEISSEMLVEVGCSHVIIGHSERRLFFGETDASINLKIRAALSASLIPVFCIGETEAQREAGETFSVLDKQVRDGLKDFVFDDLSGLVVAYEPVWAIGTGKTASKEQAQEAHQFVRSLLDTLFGKPFASAVRILYGGSVKPDNVRVLMEMPDIDGALVGGASLDPETFSKLVFFNE
ncbi:triose-phosphate isomerase [Desulfosarcina sp.]|uniref:triose-phosphate isomerase n=1 Tax=Desulfosarcina sp. TaxID=2027861 RepID=UPI0029AE43BE|nr:triose-phosphate isomerase [Desulfosarcina sp.]MDX2455653.1 triose-phosphate isomerase [Desulfosarcina sp.]MDX2493126.1 triose-phosphate isomerase [Desulfosarcina sp.]